VISGYRSPATNAKLASVGHGVARRSYHMKGMAIDVALDDRKLTSLRDSALALKAGGVGYYPKPGFVHVDVGPVRSW
ncbi:MAG: YcbK family protein, partial [Dongiaceae bacterium]